MGICVSSSVECLDWKLLSMPLQITRRQHNDCRLYLMSFVAISVHALKLLSEELFLLAEDELDRCCLLTEQNSPMKDNLRRN